jgi:hypothetical protein
MAFPSSIILFSALRIETFTDTTLKSSIDCTTMIFPKAPEYPLDIISVIVGGIPSCERQYYKRSAQALQWPGMLSLDQYP